MKSPTKTPHKTGKFHGITIGDDDVGNDTPPDYICSWCQRTLSRLIDKSGENPSHYCSYCQISFEPSEVRKKPRIETAKTNVEPAVTSIGFTPDVSIRHTPPIRGGMAELQKRGVRVTSYHTTEKE